MVMEMDIIGEVGGGPGLSPVECCLLEMMMNGREEDDDVDAGRGKNAERSVRERERVRDGEREGMTHRRKGNKTDRLSFALSVSHKLPAMMPITTFILHDGIIIVCSAIDGCHSFY